MFVNSNDLIGGGELQKKVHNLWLAKMRSAVLPTKSLNFFIIQFFKEQRILELLIEISDNSEKHYVVPEISICSNFTIFDRGLGYGHESCHMIEKRLGIQSRKEDSASVLQNKDFRKNLMKISF